MYLVIEKSDSIYAYFESEIQFKRNQRHRVASGYHQLDLSALDEECNVKAHGQYVYIVVPLDKREVQSQRRNAARRKARAHESRKRK
jgi:hypothetical protein